MESDTTALGVAEHCWAAALDAEGVLAEKFESTASAVKHTGDIAGSVGDMEVVPAEERQLPGEHVTFVTAERTEIAANDTAEVVVQLGKARHRVAVAGIAEAVAAHFHTDSTGSAGNIEDPWRHESGLAASYLHLTVVGNHIAFGGQRTRCG